MLRPLTPSRSRHGRTVECFDFRFQSLPTPSAGPALATAGVKRPQPPYRRIRPSDYLRGCSARLVGLGHRHRDCHGERDRPGSLARIEPVGFKFCVKSDSRNLQVIGRKVSRPGRWRRRVEAGEAGGFKLIPSPLGQLAGLERAPAALS
jgi:hypothetical protein